MHGLAVMSRRIDIDGNQIENNLVKNQFIINQGIEQTVLIRNSDEGAQFMKERGALSTNVKMCFTFSNGDKRRGRVMNTEASYACRSTKRPRFGTSFCHGIQTSLTM
jgi:hypothetical protein